MFEYTVRAGHGSSELLVEFQNPGSDPDFRAALAAALSPLGIELLWDGQYLNSKRAVAPGPPGDAFVESDLWDFVWGHAFGPANKENIAALDQALARTGLFFKARTGLFSKVG